jgi:hypothetical protein
MLLNEASFFGRYGNQDIYRDNQLAAIFLARDENFRYLEHVDRLSARVHCYIKSSEER